MKLAIGTAQFGLNYGIASERGQVGYQEVSEILDAAEKSGINTLDTAIAYGTSETVLGKLGIQHWKTVTKLPGVPYDCHDVEEWVYQQLNQSMERLKVTQLHGLLLHKPAQLFERFGPCLYATLQQIQARGITSKIGVSVYSPGELDKIFEKHSFDLVQAPLNILDRRLIATGWAKQLNSAGVEVHARSAFLQGLLLLPDKQRPLAFSRWSKIWSEWKRWLDEVGLAPLQACLRYLNEFSEIDKVIVGIDSKTQLVEILHQASGKLDSLPEFDSVLDEMLTNPTNWINLKVQR
jgi:aryl-alcohol dehydrogenase-like predicted oxidoreductase